MNIGEEVIEKKNVEQSSECSMKFCEHNSICIPTNIHKGFRCDCTSTDGYEGDFCERKIIKCTEGQ